MRLGVSEFGGLPIAPDDKQLSASLLLPAGHRGPAFLIFDNFRAILKYNNSSSYALAVGLLSKRFTDGGLVYGQWPKEDLPLSRSERIELQTLLGKHNYDAGNPDGIIGANTRKAIRSAQQSFGWRRMGIRRTNCWRRCVAAEPAYGDYRHREQARSQRCSRSTCGSEPARDD